MLPATIKTNLEQTSGGDPRIAIALRQYRHRVGNRYWEQSFSHKRLLLNIEEALVLFVALNYVLEQGGMSTAVHHAPVSIYTSVLDSYEEWMRSSATDKPDPDLKRP